MGEKVIFDYMYRDEVSAHVEIDLKTKEVTCEEYSDVLFKQAFGLRPANMDTVVWFFRRRCFPETQDGVEELLEMLGLKQYDPYSIVKKTKGMMWKDHCWVRFEGDTSTYEENCNRDMFSDSRS